MRSFNTLCSDWEKDEIASLKEDFSSPADREKVHVLVSVNCVVSGMSSSNHSDRALM